MKLGSFFDGIGGWLIAAQNAGVTPVWAREIDEFPAAVTAHHFPKVRQLGDITKINIDSLESADIICAGSPCQDLSVAGKREGLNGERSGLFKKAIKLIHGLRERTGKPRFFVWENVPGAFSSNHGYDFKAVLESVSQTEIPMPANDKWAEAGMVEWDGGSLAWRVLDAQYWGVPQRRKRIFLVADFGGQSAGEILFERQGLPRDPAKSQGERKEAAEGIGKSIDGTIEVMPFDTTQITSQQNGSHPTYGKPCHNLNANAHVAAIVIKAYDMTNADEVMRPVTGDKSNCLNSRMGTGGNQVPVIHTIAGNIIGRANHNGGHQLGIGQDISPTLNTIDRHAVAVDVRNLRETEEVSGTLQAKKTGGYSLNYQNPVRINNNFYTRQSISEFKETGAASTLRTRDYKDYTDVVTVNKSVRRLTPTECERLQGLPDGYTDIEFRGRPAPDSKRYKALGNGMAQPCADFVIRRILEVARQ